MNRQKAISNRLLLGAIFVGLNLLCFLGVMHGHRMGHHTRVNYSHIPAHGSRRSGSRSDRTGLGVSVDTAVDHTTIAAFSNHHVTRVSRSAFVAPQMAVVPAKFTLPVHEAIVELLARENVLALGSAPRAPGLGRAPPTA